MTRVQWRAAKRIISTRFPSVGILDRLVDPAELDVLLAIDARTNPRINEDLGALAHIPSAERVVGPGSTVIMAPFAHPNPDGSRFSDGTFGVFYAAHRLPTAIAEIRYHRERFMRASHEVAQALELMLYEANVRGRFPRYSREHQSRLVQSHKLRALPTARRKASQVGIRGRRVSQRARSFGRMPRGVSPVPHRPLPAGQTALRSLERRAHHGRQHPSVTA